MILSVAITTYNGDKYIKDQLLSIVTQSLKVNEIVICDDGSSDNTIDIISTLSKDYPSIKWNVSVNKFPLGVTKNFEKALSLCTGDIIFLSDQDDIWIPSKTKLIVEFFESHPDVNLVFSDAELIDGNGKLKTDKTLFDACGLNQLKELWNMGLQFEIENVIQRLLGATFGLRREFVERCLPFNPRIHNYHDGQLAMNAVVQGCSGMIDKCLIQYRIHGNNVVGLGGNNNWVFSNKEKPNEIAYLLEPRQVNPFFLSSKADKIRKRIDFFQKRVRCYCSLKGKIILFFYIYKYIRYYNKSWMLFFLSDILYGTSNSLRKQLLHSLCR